MKYECRVSKKTLGYVKKLKTSTCTQNYKILKQIFFKSVPRYYIIHSWLSIRVFADIFKEALQKRRIWVNTVSLVFVKDLSISLTVLKKVHLWLLNKGQ